MFRLFKGMSTATQIRRNNALTDEEMMQYAPSIFAENAHESRSKHYTYIPTAHVLSGLRKEGFQPFMVAQARVRHEDKKEYTRHMLRLRHHSQLAGEEANEIILLNSHDGTSSYQMFAGMYRFVCANGLVTGTTTDCLRVPHRGNVVDHVIEGAYSVLNDFESVIEQRAEMKSLILSESEEKVFAKAALALRYDETDGPAPITELQVLRPRRSEDFDPTLWSTFNRTQENLVKGGLAGRNRSGRRATTRAVSGMDSNVRLNRALWTLAEEMRLLKAA